MSRFAQFFISPLLSPDATHREVRAVDSGDNHTHSGNPDINFMCTCSSHRFLGLTGLQHRKVKIKICQVEKVLT